MPVRQIAEALAGRLGVPAKSAPAEQIADEIPFVGRYLAGDFPATSTSTSTRTRDLLGWEPVGHTLLDDIVTTSPRATTANPEQGWPGVRRAVT